MDVYFSPEAFKALETYKIIVTRQNSDGIILGHKRGKSFFVERIVSTTQGFFPSLEKFYSLNTIYKDSIIGFYSFFTEKKKTKKILAPFSHGKLFLDIRITKSNTLQIKPYSIEYDKEFFFSPLKLTLPQPIDLEVMDNNLTTAQEKILLELAREAISFFLKTGETLEKDIPDKSLLEKRGVFVTLKVKGELRGCIGYPVPHKSLYNTIIDAAVSAASSDFRFQPLTTEELQETKIEISVLTPPRPVKDISEIKVGIHGIIISKGPARGLLLPQVPLEWKWDLETYLEHGCQKAGLDKDDWKKDAKIEIFSARIFSE